jgi:hypothetical protein
MAYRPVLLSRVKEYPLPPQVLWDLLANTDNLDREIGMPYVSYGPLTVTADAIYRRAMAGSGPLTGTSWREYPFEWVRGERYAVLRLFERGLLDSFYGGIEVSPSPAGSRLRLFGELTPRSLPGWFAARLLGGKGLRDTLAYCDRFLRDRLAGDLGLPPASRRTATDPTRLQRLLERASQAGIASQIVRRFGRHLADAPDPEVLRMRPYALADGWGAPREEVLRLLAAAEREGGLVRSWEVMCPNCRVPKVSATELTGIPPRFHCDTCGIDFESDLSRWVELRFSVHPALRPAREEIYCAGGPANSPHVYVQQYLPPRKERLVSVELAAEPYRARILRGLDVCPLEPDGGGPAEALLTYREDGWYQITQRFRPGRVTLRLRNETAQVAVAVIEQALRDPCAITAAELLQAPGLAFLTEPPQRG